MTTNQVAAQPHVSVSAATIVDWIVTGFVVPDATDKRRVRKVRIRLSARKVGGR